VRLLAVLVRAQAKRTGHACRDPDHRADQRYWQPVIAELGLQFPIGYGADPAAVARATGAVVNPDPAYLQSTGFVLDPDGNALTSVYSSGAIGRLTPDDVIGFIRYTREHTADRAG
jgi:hypothetical protein